MPVLERPALADSPLADLHAIASELGVDGFRRLRREDLIDAIVARQGGGEAEESRDRDGDEETSEASGRSRRRRGGRGRGRDRDRDERGERGERGERDRDADEAPRAEREPRAERAEKGGSDEDRVVSGTVEVLGNGSGFVRLNPPESSDEDVYVSAAQVRRCELVSGDTVAGPVRAPRRSERYPSLVRVDTVNGRPADEASDGVRFDDLTAAWPDERIALGAEDPTAKAIEWLTPFGRGSRVVIAGGPRSGKTEALRRLAELLAKVDGLETTLVLAGVRPEEAGDWSEIGVDTAATLSFAASADALSNAVERAIDNAKRVAARGGHAVVLVDTLDGLHPAAARKALAAARNIAGGGSLTVIATASEPHGGETTVVALDAELAGARRFPSLDLLASGTLRPELLVGEAGAEAIAAARAEAAE